MQTNNSTTIIKHSFYWLLPVILLNVFTNVGLQANMVELPHQVQTEQLFGGGQAPALTYLAPASIVVKLVAAPTCSWLTTRRLTVSSQVVPSVISVHPTVKSLRRFYGKAAPEALDAWRRH
jgi:hypothetical protein